LESVADINEAALQTTTGNMGEALRLYQHALRLDDAEGDRRSSTEDWFTYGQFLDTAGFPARFVYACYTKAESLENSLPGASNVESVKAARKQIEKRLGARLRPSAAIRNQSCARRWPFAHRRRLTLLMFLGMFAIATILARAPATQWQQRIQQPIDTCVLLLNN
jgi:hypothetical protein